MRPVTVALAIGAACSVQSEPKTLAVPGDTDFRYVSGMLGARCGSLDCHGQSTRSLRLYSRLGLRLSPDGVSGRGQATEAEHDANYSSLVASEPEILSRVFREGGRDPARLTFVRKARGTESHKGGRAVDEQADRCIASWLEGEIDKKACFQASVLARPPGFGVGTGGGGAGGTGGQPAGGAAGSGASGGSLVGGSGGVPSGGGTLAAGSGGDGGGYVCGTSFWPCANDFYTKCTAQKPAPPAHIAYADSECQSCHAPGGDAGGSEAFLFSGVVWDFATKKGAERVEVAVLSGSDFYLTCTDALGFFFVPAQGQPTPNWALAETRIRGELGEKIMPSDKKHEPSCNSSDCHAHVEHRLWAP